LTLSGRNPCAIETELKVITRIRRTGPNGWAADDCHHPALFLYPKVSIIDRHAKGGCGIMKTLVGGAVAAALGLIGLGFWWKEFLAVLGGTIPAVLLLGGGLAIYLGFDEMKDTWKKDEPAAAPVSADEMEKYKSEISDLKKELDSLKAGSKSE
jgi:hypothetical protein